MEDEFFFSLLRISIAQILKASGFDKCRPSVLNIVTDLYIKHLQLIAAKAQKFALARASDPNGVSVSDVLEAFLAAGTIKQLRFGSVDGKLENDDSNTYSGEAFLKWLRYSDQYRVSKALSEVPASLIHNLMEKRRIDTLTETDQERKKRRLKERQDFYNQLKQGEDANQMEAMGGYVDDLDDDEINSGDRLLWLTYLAEKDLKLGHNLKFVNSCIQDSLIDVHKNPKFHPTSKDGDHAGSIFQDHILNSTRNDHILLQIHETDAQDGQEIPSVLASLQLKDLLPYNVKYNLVLSDDSLSQYVAYAAEHPEEIQARQNLASMQETQSSVSIPEISSAAQEDKANASVNGDKVDVEDNAQPSKEIVDTPNDHEKPVKDSSTALSPANDQDINPSSAMDVDDERQSSANSPSRGEPEKDSKTCEEVTEHDKESEDTSEIRTDQSAEILRTEEEKDGDKIPEKETANENTTENKSADEMVKDADDKETDDTVKDQSLPVETDNSDLNHKNDAHAESKTEEPNSMNSVDISETRIEESNSPRTSESVTIKKEENDTKNSAESAPAQDEGDDK